MRPRWSRRCRKVRYRTQLDAKIVLARLTWKDRDERRAYPCQRCRGWHLTSQEARRDHVGAAA